MTYVIATVRMRRRNKANVSLFLFTFTTHNYLKLRDFLVKIGSLPNEIRCAEFAHQNVFVTYIAFTMWRHWWGVWDSRIASVGATVCCTHVHPNAEYTFHCDENYECTQILGACIISQLRCHPGIWLIQKTRVKYFQCIRCKSNEL